MSITVNDGGVLRRLDSVSVNDGGVIRNLGSVSANDGGVIREIFAPKKIEIAGITPLVSAEDHIVIVESGTFTLSLPKGARIILGSFAYGGYGGYVAEYTLNSSVKNASCTATIALSPEFTALRDSARRDATKLVIGGTTYSCGIVERVIQSKWGPIGGRGGIGAYDGHAATDGTGAGGGGGAYLLIGDPAYNSGKGGNSGGYGNYGGNGGGAGHKNGFDGASGKGGAFDYSACGGGGGGYAAGGGGGGWENDDSDCPDSSEPGNAGGGIIVIEL